MNVTAHLFSVGSSSSRNKQYETNSSSTFALKEASSNNSNNNTNTSSITNNNNSSNSTRKFVSRSFSATLGRSSKRVTPPPTTTTTVTNNNNRTHTNNNNSVSVAIPIQQQHHHQNYHNNNNNNGSDSVNSTPSSTSTASTSSSSMDVDTKMEEEEEDDDQQQQQQIEIISTFGMIHTSHKLYEQAVIPPQHPEDHGKLTLVLDIDETLVHARLPDDVEFRQIEDRLHSSKTEFSGDKFELCLRPGERFTVNKRPGLDDFLRHAASKYEIIAYTAAVEEYAKPLLDQLDPHRKIFRHRLYRNHCIFANGHYLKDLRRVNRRMERVVLVDNNAYCFLPQLNNGIPISSFYNDHTDTALTVLTKFLNALHVEEDVQPLLRETFNLERILKKDREQLFLELDE